MEPIIEFLEQYWGISVVGGVTVGTLITFAILMIKNFIKDRKNFGIVNSLIKAFESEREKRIEKQEATDAALAEAREEKQQMDRVVTTLFEAVGYLTMASKLPIKEKIEIQKRFSEAIIVPVKATVVEEAKEVVEEVISHKDDIKESVTEAVAKTKTLLDTFLEEK